MKLCTLGLVALTISAFLAGCGWTPTRDNTIDPDSPYFQPPPPENHAPVIDSVFLVTDCHANAFANFCAFDVVAYISDSDKNIDLNSVTSAIEISHGNWDELGHLGYDPERQRFTLTKYASDFPDGQIENLFGKSVRIDVQDAVNSADSSTLLFPLPLTDYPTIVFPFDFGDDVASNHPRLSWIYWHAPTGNHTFSVHVFFMQFEPVWDTTGLAPSDTFVVVTDSLADNNFGTSFYTWELTVTDENGNRATSEPGFFRILLPSRLSGAAGDHDWITSWRSRRRRPRIIARLGHRRAVRSYSDEGTT